MNSIREILNLINEEGYRQRHQIQLIASENFVSSNILKAQGSILTNKYAEGYPEKRYYNGTRIVDQIEKIAINSAKKLFNVKYVNVQPYSGSQANMAVYMALLENNDKILSMDLQSGGHLTHGSSVNFSGKLFKVYNYGINSKGMIDYKEISRIAKEVRPNLIIAGYSNYPYEFDFKKFKKIASDVNAYLLADISHISGLVATGFHNSPVNYADVITTTTHKTLRGARGGIIMTNDEKIFKKINSSVFPGLQGGPLMHVIAAKAITFQEALDPSFSQYIKNVIDNASTFLNEFKKLGAITTTNKTNNHLFTVNVLKSYNLTGKEAANILESVNIICNKNLVPNDTKSPHETSGIRLGTPAMTTLGFGKEHFIKMARIIDSILKNPNNKNKDIAISQVEELLIEKTTTIKSALQDLSETIKSAWNKK